MNERILAALISLTVTGCPRDREQPLTLEQATQALEEATVASEAESLTGSSVDIATRFTLGQGVEHAVSEIRAVLAAEMPCAETALDGGTLTVEYGAREGNCSYRGQSLSGVSKISVAYNAPNRVRVDHEWIALTNGRVRLDGTAEITWDEAARTRRVVHQATWTHLASGRVVHGSGDRIQTALAGGLTEGIQVEGTRSWEGEQGSWDLVIDEVQMRWIDPVPQSGSYTLSTPFARSLRLTFGRVDDDTIAVTVDGPRRSFDFTVSREGNILRD
jgi:hypothetical protein